MPFRIDKLENQILPTSSYALCSDERERKFLKKLSTDCKKGSVVVYVAKHNDDLAGLVGISAAKVGNIPSVQIEYIIVFKGYRKDTNKELGMKVSSYLLALCMDIASSVKSVIGLRWLILTPDNEKLEKFYGDEFGFVAHNDIMYLKIPKKQK